MREVDALTPQVPPMAPTVGLTEAFAKLEERERKHEAAAARIRHRRSLILSARLGPDWHHLPNEDAYVSRDGRLRMSRTELDYLEGRY